MQNMNKRKLALKLQKAILKHKKIENYLKLFGKKAFFSCFLLKHSFRQLFSVASITLLNTGCNCCSKFVFLKIWFVKQLLKCKLSQEIFISAWGWLIVFYGLPDRKIIYFAACCNCLEPLPDVVAAGWSAGRYFCRLDRFHGCAGNLQVKRYCAVEAFVR